MRNKGEVVFLFLLLTIGALGDSAQPPLLSSHCALFLGALIPASCYYIYAGGSPIYFSSPILLSEGQAYVPNCQVAPDVVQASLRQQVKTGFIILLFSLSPSSNPCPGKWRH